MVNKNVIVEKIAEKYYDSKAKTEKVVSEVFDIILKTLTETDEKVNISGFGVFQVKQTKERKARNPKTGEEILVPAKRKVVFKPSQVVKKIFK